MRSKFMSNTWCVYCHQNKVNGKKYFGITSRKPICRWGQNGQCYGFYFGRAVEKYGWDNFEHYVLYSCLTYEIATAFERLLIEAFSTNDSEFGYNLTGGGEGMLNPSDETRAKLSEIRKGHIVTPETRLKLSENNKGKHNHSAETRAKISKANKGKVISAETRAKISKNSASRRPEVKAKMSASRKGIPNVNKGKKFTEEEKARIYGSRRGRHWKMSEEGRAKISLARRAYEQRKKLRTETEVDPE